MSSKRPAELATALAEVVRRLGGQRDTESSLRTIVEAAVAAVPGADFGGIALLGEHGEVLVRVETDPLLTEIDELQTELREGPCLHALTEAQRVVSRDLAADERWSTFGRRMAERGVRSALSLRLDAERLRGTLSLFAHLPDAFTPDSEVIGELFAAHAATALAGVQREEHLQRAVRSRDLIGVAKGIVMVQHGLDEQAAFGVLVRLSQEQNVKLHDVARRLVALTEERRAHS